MKPGILDDWKIILRYMIKGGIGFLCLFGKGHPKLQAMKGMNRIAHDLCFAFGMGNTAARIQLRSPGVISILLPRLS